ncbi:hexosaminidase [Mangrovibacterium marinum]|uniref:beta-N-acetylhexosaminidase n=1 Tax=Mangrovibacterium marinum TaxID=1639118 RepID=A0A2T5BXZ0_9BACT|nr:glycoside hydrolase family 20 protein [Mangrovibacterium marinum]PTN06300.1 hexosaminidase [Mangrovibacterium marinum]
MKLTIYTLALIVCCLFAGCNARQAASPDAAPAVVPAPVAVEKGEGYFKLSKNTTYFVEDDLQQQLADRFFKGLELALGGCPKQMQDPDKADILFQSATGLGDEAYRLEITPRKIRVEAETESGFFYATQTLRLLLPAAIEAASAETENAEYRLPALAMTDYPRFAYRGLMLDVSRYFIPKETVLEIIDAMAMLKMNKLHLHLVDDNGWRIEIKKYPKLTDVGAWRVERDEPFPARPNALPGEKATIGGFYTQDDIREMVNYAGQRQVEIIPEIEMPAHTNSSLAAYPELACSVVHKPITVLSGLGGKNAEIIYCAGKEKVFHFLEDVIDEVAELFPSKYIHLGGDEAAKTYWKRCPDCQARMKAEKLPNEEELQSYFMKRMSRNVQSKGKEVLGWDELTNSELPDDAIIFGWRGDGQAALKAARQGHRFVLTPAKKLYLIRYQGPQWFEPLTYFGNNTLQDVYNYEPVGDNWEPGLDSLLMGVQGSLWTEFCNAPEDVEYLVFPRLVALAEVAWSPKGTKNWPGFLPALDNYLAHLEQKGITYARSMYNIDHLVRPSNGTLLVGLSCIRPDVEIRLTTDGSEPTANSAGYTDSLRVEKATVIKAATFRKGVQTGKTLTLDLLKNKATACPVTAENGRAYVLTNGLRGSDRHSDFEWAGWYNQDAVFEVDLGREQPISAVTLGTVSNAGMGVFRPAKVRLLVSDDQTNYTTVAEITESDESIFEAGTKIKDLDFGELNVRGRYLKIEAQNPGHCPPGLPRVGQATWMYFDELMVH